MLEQLKERIKKFLGIPDPEAGKRGRYEVYALRLQVGRHEASPALTSDGTFYVGSGVYPTRKEQHLKGAQKKAMTVGGKMDLDHKEKILLWAVDNGFPLEYATLWRTDNREEAYCIEKNVINYYGIEHLANAVYGHCNVKALENSQHKDEYCRVCGVQLEVDINIPAKRVAKKDYICTSCNTVQLRQWRLDNQPDRTLEGRKRAAKMKQLGACRSGCGNRIGTQSTIYCDSCAQKNRDNANRYYRRKKSPG